MFGMSREVTVLLGSPFLVSLVRRENFLVGPFWSMPVGIFRLPGSLSPSLGYMKLKEHTGNFPQYHSLGPGVPSLLAFFSLPFRGLHLFNMLCLSFSLYSRRKRGKYFYLVFLEEVLHWSLYSRFYLWNMENIYLIGWYRRLNKYIYKVLHSLEIRKH